MSVRLFVSIVDAEKKNGIGAKIGELYRVDECRDDTKVEEERAEGEEFMSKSNTNLGE